MIDTPWSRSSSRNFSGTVEFPRIRRRVRTFDGITNKRAQEEHVDAASLSASLVLSPRSVVRSWTVEQLEVAKFGNRPRIPVLTSRIAGENYAKVTKRCSNVSPPWCGAD